MVNERHIMQDGVLRIVWILIWKETRMCLFQNTFWKVGGGVRSIHHLSRVGTIVYESRVNFARRWGSFRVSV